MKEIGPRGRFCRPLDPPNYDVLFGPPEFDPGLKLSVTGLDGPPTFKTYRRPRVVNVSEVFRDILKNYVLQTTVA